MQWQNWHSVAVVRLVFLGRLWASTDRLHRVSDTGRHAGIVSPWPAYFASTQDEGARFGLSSGTRQPTVPHFALLDKSTYLLGLLDTSPTPATQGLGY
ncbi:hypothetical protein F5Y18DRAFT_402154 [Xylariaceae sp. FL1019]|nr:hypothetical protein F5Y18DRAFT_402154 [Xylariaceae sp. FL1019]